MSENKTNTDEIVRESISEDDKWQLEDLYASKDAWQKKKSDIEERIKKLIILKGTIKTSGKDLLGILEEYYYL